MVELKTFMTEAVARMLEKLANPPSSGGSDNLPTTTDVEEEKAAEPEFEPHPTGEADLDWYS